MPDLKADEIVLQRHKRAFVQYGGPLPANPAKYAGQDANYLTITGVAAPESGGVDAIWVADPSKIGGYRLVARSITPADLPNATITFREKHGSLPRTLLSSCPFNIYEATGKCADLSDFSGGWSDYVMVYSGALVTDKDLGDRTSFDSDDPVEDQLSVTLEAIYPVGALGFGENAAAQVDREVVDVVFAGDDLCGSCATGDQRLYAVVKPSGAGSPGLQAEVVYSVDGGGSWAQINIDSFGASEEPLAIDAVGKYLVVIGSGAYFYAEINTKTGVPGTFTKVTTGFNASGAPRDLFVASPREIWFVGNGGYIYKSTDITAGVTVVNAASATTSNLLRVHGRDNVIIATGASGAVVKTTNRGATWTTTTASPENSSIQAVQVLADDRFWVGCSTGRVYYTTNGGETWTLNAITGTGSGTITDILFPTPEVGYIAHATTTPDGRIYATWNGGANWSRTAPRINNLPVHDRPNRLAAPVNSDPGWAANTLAVGGLAGDGTDGIVLIGTVAKI